MSDNGSGERLGDKCRSGCKTRDHESYAACLKDGAIQIGNLRGDDD